MAGNTTPGNTTPGTTEHNLNTDEEIAPETVAAEELARRRAVARATDDADASHEGGMGAQGGAVDFGNPKNFAS